MKLETVIAAPADRCFDAARDIDLHVQSVRHTGESALAGKTSGLIGLGDAVTFRGRHFGVTQQFTSQITVFDRPKHFRDEMLKGAFRSFLHDHFFVEAGGRTTMVDVVQFRAPLGLLGRFADWLFLRSYLRRLLQARAQAIRLAAETNRY